MPTGMVTRMKIGRTDIMRAMVEINERTCVSQLLMVAGKLLSQTSTSLENLLTILPIGVVSKKDIGDLIILVSIFMCSIFEPFKVSKENIKELTIISIA